MMRIKILSPIMRAVEEKWSHHRQGRKKELHHRLAKEPLPSTELTSASYIPNLPSNQALINVTDAPARMRPEQVAFIAELEELSLDRPFNPLKALERKAEIEARHFFLQRVHEEPARLETLLDIYTEWVGRISTPPGLADFILIDHDDGMVGNGEELVEEVKKVKGVEML